MSVAIFDIDGVVADVRHRTHYLDRWPPDWGRFFDEAHRDPLLEQGHALVHAASKEHDIVWLTGRPEWLRLLTEDWFDEHDLPQAELIMRQMDDFRPAPYVKVEALRALAPRGIASFVDDDPLVIAAAGRAGVRGTLATWVRRDAGFAQAQDEAGRT